MTTIVVHSLTNCSNCEKAKEHLKNMNKQFEEKVYNKSSDTDSIMFLIELTNWTTFPQIFIDDVFIGGYEQLLAYEFDENAF